eukprot:TRINITY_DN35_c0_g1_i1.p1 TRINITY_DN35_c0_g1~~TRINITY_DN35_c0_g1_i1.p1  ORF type:complete len:332 (+),score=45.67 TRINITY_DN35_c0_g1_i1:264-1259(+)
MASRKILLAVDNSHEAKYALEYALKHLCTSADHLTILHCYPELATVSPSMGPVSYFQLNSPSSPSISEIEERRRSFAEELVKGYCDEAKAAKIPCEAIVREGEAREVIVDAVDEFHCDVLLVGSRNLGPVKGAFLGSVSQHCMHHAKCPVMIIRRPKWSNHGEDNSSAEADKNKFPEATGKKRTVVIAVDDSQGSKDAFRWALEKMLDPATDRIVLVTAETLSPAIGFSEFVTSGMEEKLVRDLLAAGHKLLDDLVREAKAKGFEGKTDIVQGDPREAIPWATLQFHGDLLIMGSRGRGPMKSLLLGSTSAYCARNVDCPVLIVRPKSSAA